MYLFWVHGLLFGSVFVWAPPCWDGFLPVIRLLGCGAAKPGAADWSFQTKEDTSDPKTRDGACRWKFTQFLLSWTVVEGMRSPTFWRPDGNKAGLYGIETSAGTCSELPVCQIIILKLHYTVSFIIIPVRFSKLKTNAVVWGEPQREAATWTFLCYAAAMWPEVVLQHRFALESTLNRSDYP